MIAVANHYLWHPSVVHVINPVSGETLQEYWHPGSIYLCHLYDLDGDAKEELLFAAINNPGEGLGHAAVSVLDIPFTRASRVPFPWGGGELAYILLPTPDVSQVMGTLPIPSRLEIEQGGRILVQVPAAEAAMTYYLDRHLNLLEHRVTDNFRPLHFRLRNQELLDHELSTRELQALGRPARFASAPDGNSPAVERIWAYR